MYPEKSQSEFQEEEALLRKYLFSYEKFGITNIGKVITTTRIIGMLAAKDNRRI